MARTLLSSGRYTAEITGSLSYTRSANTGSMSMIIPGILIKKNLIGPRVMHRMLSA